MAHDNNLPSQHGLLFQKATFCPTRVRANGIMVAAQLKGRPKSTVSGALWTEQASGVKTAEVSRETIPIPKKKTFALSVAAASCMGYSANAASARRSLLLWRLSVPL